MADDINADDSAMDQNTATDPAATDPAATDPAATDPAGDDESGAPEEYADFELPAGMEMNTELLEKVAPVFKEVNISQEDAQKLITAYADQQVAEAQSAQEAYDNQITEWETAVKADPEIGGDKFEESLGLAKQALATYGSEGAIEFLERTGAGSNPEIIRLLVNAGRALKEDNPGVGGPPGKKKSITERLYPNNQ